MIVSMCRVQKVVTRWNLSSLANCSAESKNVIGALCGWGSNCCFFFMISQHRHGWQHRLQVFRSWRRDGRTLAWQNQRRQGGRCCVLIVQIQMVLAELFPLRMVVWSSSSTKLLITSREIVETCHISHVKWPQVCVILRAEQNMLPRCVTLD